MKTKLIGFLIKIKKKLGKGRRDFLYYKLWRKVYQKSASEPIDENLCVFAYSELYKEMPDNLRLIRDELESKGFECRVFSRETGDKRTRSRVINELLKYFDGIEFQKAYARCKCLFLNDAYFPAYSNQPRQGQKVIQLWHACGAFKKWGYSTVDKEWGATKEALELYPVHNTYTDVFVSSEKVRFAYAEAFNCSIDKVKALGVPRTDVFFENGFAENGRAKIMSLFPSIGERKIILYAPTFRGNDLRHSYSEKKLDLIAMKKSLGDDYALVLKLHPLTANMFSLTDEEKAELGSFVFDASKCVTINDALGAADIVVSDYSSLIFEYSLLSRPMVFFAYDLEEYDRTRSFYFDYKDFVPGEIVTDTSALVSEIKRLEVSFDVVRVKRFKDEFMSACDGHSTERIINSLFKKE